MAINIAGQTFVPASLIYSDGWAKYAAGSNTFDATAITATDYITVAVGFIPKYIKWDNVTDRILNEWYDGMAQDSAVNTVAAGTRTLSVTGGTRGFIVGVGPGATQLASANSGVVPGPGQFQISQNATLGAILASKVCRWQAWG